jgi:hypothetical protein
MKLFNVFTSLLSLFSLVPISRSLEPVDTSGVFSKEFLHSIHHSGRFDGVYRNESCVFMRKMNPSEGYTGACRGLYDDVVLLDTNETLEDFSTDILSGCHVISLEDSDDNDTLIVNFTDLDLERRLQDLERSDRRLQDSETPPHGPLERWTNCYFRDHLPGSVHVGIVVSTDLWNFFGQDDLRVYEWVAGMTTLTNFIYQGQLNIKIVLDQVYIPKTPIGTPNWNQCVSMYTLATRMTNWQSRPKQLAAWHLLHRCSVSEVGNIIGVAYLNTLCKNSFTNVGITLHTGDFTWLTYAHEFGHIFGASHTFEEGVGQTGGIMDYGSPQQRQVDGKFQFNSKYRRSQLCTRMQIRLFTYLDEITCPYFSQCGDHELQLDEECDPPDGITCSEECKLINNATQTPFPTDVPTLSPTNRPSTPYPVDNPTRYPTRSPTPFPTNYPTSFPTVYPTTPFPSWAPTSPTFSPRPRDQLKIKWEIHPKGEYQTVAEFLQSPEFHVIDRVKYKKRFNKIRYPKGEYGSVIRTFFEPRISGRHHFGIKCDHECVMYFNSKEIVRSVNRKRETTAEAIELDERLFYNVTIVHMNLQDKVFIRLFWSPEYHSAFHQIPGKRFWWY